MVWATADWTGYFQSDAPVFVAPRMLPCATKLLRPEGKMMSALRFAPLFALLLSACHSAQPPAPNPAAPNFFAGCASAKKECAWVKELQWRITHNFSHGERYRGQRCDVTLNYDARRGYQVLRTEGDEPLCLQAWQTVGSTPQLPPPPPGASQQAIITFSPDAAG